MNVKGAAIYKIFGLIIYVKVTFSSSYRILLEALYGQKCKMMQSNSVLMEKQVIINKFLRIKVRRDVSIAKE